MGKVKHVSADTPIEKILSILDQDAGVVIDNFLSSDDLNFIKEEIENSKLYREFNVNYDKFNIDLKKEEGTVDTTFLINKAKTFFKKNDLKTITVGSFLGKNHLYGGGFFCALYLGFQPSLL